MGRGEQVANTSVCPKDKESGSELCTLPAIKSLNKALGKNVMVCSGEKHGLTYFQNRVLQRIKYIEHLINNTRTHAKSMEQFS